LHDISRVTNTTFWIAYLLFIFLLSELLELFTDTLPSYNILIR